MIRRAAFARFATLHQSASYLGLWRVQRAFRTAELHGRLKSNLNRALRQITLRSDLDTPKHHGPAFVKATELRSAVAGLYGIRSGELRQLRDLIKDVEHEQDLK